MINEQLWARAERLAAQRYAIILERDWVADNTPVVLLRHPELPAVKAYGHDEDEAKRNLDDARVDYIYTLLVEELPVPMPHTVSSADTDTNSPIESVTWTVGPSTDDQNATADDSQAFVLGLSFGGDLLKQP